MRKKLWFAVAILLFSAVISSQIADVAVANPVPWPLTPNQDKPTLTITSPANNTALNNSDVWLGFTVVESDSWNDPQWFFRYIGGLNAVNAYLDGNSVNITEAGSAIPGGLSHTFLANLNLSTSGSHVFNVTVLAYTYYRGPAYNGSHIPASINSTSGIVYQYPLAVSEAVYFTSTQPNSSPSHTQQPGSETQAGVILALDWQTTALITLAVAAVLAVALVAVLHKGAKK
jgi:hypothetical protein